MFEGLQIYIQRLEQTIILLMELIINLFSVVSSLHIIVFISFATHIIAPATLLIILYWFDMVDYFEAKKEKKGGQNGTI